MKINLPINKLAILVIGCQLSIINSSAQFSFTNSNSLLHSNTGVAGSNAGTFSGNSMTVVDMNNDGLDDICKLDQNRYVRIEYQQPGGTFTYQYAGDVGSNSAWSMCAGDVDRNGYKDVLVGYNGSLKLMKIDAAGSMGVTTLPNSSFFLQNINFMDVNNDGWLDIFACDDNSFPKLYMNDGTGNYPAEAGNSVINFDVTPGQTTNTSNDDSGNYGSVWTDIDNDGDVDLYVAHCRQSVASGTDPRRIDKLFINNGGVFTENAAAHGLGSGDQDWTSSFADIDNDGDFDLFLTKHNTSSAWYQNNGNGNFGAAVATFSFGQMPMQSVLEDMDNDGFVDVIMTGDNDTKIYHNNGNATFTDATPANLFVTGSNMLSFASGDLNHDGKVDMYATYATTYNNPATTIDDIYWQNSINNGNHFITLVMAPTLSNHDALGARAFIYGAWGVQTREVRGGESYGTLNTEQLHFGLGSATTIDSVVVNWPSGVHTVIISPSTDIFLSVGESNQCTLTNASITSSGPMVLCGAGTVTLDAPTGTGYTYLWSNGATTPSITVSTTGSYAVTVTQSGNCNSTSPSVSVISNPNETPTVSSSSNVLTFCDGNFVTLTSSAAASYLWSDGTTTTQSLLVNQSGTYSVTIQGACQTWTSTAITVNVLPAPSAPTGADVYIATPQSVTLTATGTADVWFTALTGGTQLATGNNYVTPVVNADTTFYVEDQNSYGGSSGNTGQTFHYGTAYNGSATNAYLIFNVLNPCTLQTVKVYTDSPGNRLIELRNSSGTVITSLMVNIPVDTSVITLNFPLAAGNGFQLGTNTAQNVTTLGFNSPRLERSSSNSTYPYNFGSLVSITGNSQASSSNYYYFYDWVVVDPPQICPSPRHPQSVLFNTLGINNSIVENGISVFPNPATSSVNIKMNEGSVGSTIVELTDLSGRLVSSVSVGSTAKGQTITYDVNEVAKGVYFIKVRNGEKQLLRKLIIE